MPNIRIQALGTFSMWRDGTAVPDEVWPTSKSKQLFKILLTDRGHLVSADRLIEYLWPNLSLKKAQNNLWVTVGQARRVLQPNLPPRTRSAYIIKHDEGYLFETNSDHWLDVDAFSDHLQTAQQVADSTIRIETLEKARQLYLGDFLEDDPYAEWALAPRDQLREQYLNLLADLAETYAQQGQYRHAIGLCRQSLALENSRESTYRQLMLYLYCAGEQPAALQLYDEVRQVMWEEIGVEPAPETSNLFHQIQRRQVIEVDEDEVYPRPVSTPVSTQLLGQTPFVGRAQEYGQLTTMVNQAGQGNGCVVFVSGEPGIGKSRLVRETAVFAGKEGFTTLFAHSYQVEQAMPYQPLVDLVRYINETWSEQIASLPTVWLREIGALVPEIAGTATGQAIVPTNIDENQQGRLFQAIVHLLSAIAGENGLMLNVDDIHWADTATLQFLHYLARRVSGERMLLACTYRHEEVTADEHLATLIHHLQREPHVAFISLDRLSNTDIDELLVALESVPTTWSEWLYGETSGNPFFLVSILQSLQERGELDETAPVDTLPTNITLPEAIQESVRGRLRQATQLEQQVLGWMAVFGRNFNFATLQAITSQSQLDLLEAVENLLQRQLWQETADGYDFSHHKIREVVYHDLSGARRVMYHGQIAETLAQSTEDHPALLAHHFERAGNTGQALAYWLRAGEKALNTYALQQAVRHYERALALAEGAADEMDAYEGLGRAFMLLDKVAQATTVLQQGIQLAETQEDDSRYARLLFTRAQLANRQHKVTTNYVHAALSAAERAGDLALVAQNLLLLTEIYEGQGILNDALTTITRAQTISDELGDIHLAARIRNEIGFVHTQRGEFAEAIDVVKQALKPLAQLEDRMSLAYSWNLLGRAYGGYGDYQQAIEAFQRSRVEAEAVGDGYLIVQTPNMLGWLYRELCAFEQALHFDQEGIAVAQEWAKEPPEVSARLNVCLDVLHLGEPDRALGVLGEIQERIEAGAFGFHAWRWRLRILHARGLCLLALNQLTAVLLLMEEGLTLAKSATVRKYIALYHEVKGLALARLEQTADAISELETAVQLADAIHYQPLCWQGRAHLAALYTDVKRLQDAKTNLTAAHQIIRHIANHLTDGILQNTFLNAVPVQAIIRQYDNSIT